MPARRVSQVDKQVGLRVRARRLEQGLTQDALAKQLGLTFQQVQKYEKGNNRISVGRMIQIADALQTDVSSLMGVVAEASGAAPASRFTSFLATTDGIQIIEAMVKINSPVLRRAVLQLARTLAAELP